ncbi:NADH dehydrogenase [ubiquinone] 1 beta subcomplex subunit 1 isoform X1 [Ambystoma mexicanum]|uniref:NADH dehydrogenase [ubiquinone] 1 beta subcomplex subunit 1 isoform X1 n=1 Tax=Ambystoma mexicanum TaxID=8296 RepID=UPI0037E8C513
MKEIQSKCQLKELEFTVFYTFHLILMCAGNQLIILEERIFIPSSVMNSKPHLVHFYVKHLRLCPLPTALCLLSLLRWVATMVKVLNFVRDHWANVFVPLGFVIGWYWDRKNDEGLTEFRNKSLLFKRELRPNEEVTWK